jgi:hypothetical protein
MPRRCGCERPLRRRGRVALEELTTRGLIVERDEAHMTSDTSACVRSPRSGSDSHAGACCTGASPRRSSHATRISAIVARHLELAGRDAKAALTYAAAGEGARGLLAGTEAIAHFEAAIALGHPSRRRSTKRSATSASCAGSTAMRSPPTTPLARPGVAGDRGRLEQKVGAVHERRGDWQLAASHYEQALALGADAASVQADRSRVAWRQGDAVRARASALEALALAEQAERSARRGPGAQHPRPRRGRPNAPGAKSRDRRPSWTTASVRIAALNNLARDLTREGELDRARELLGDGAGAVSQTGRPASRGGAAQQPRRRAAQGGRRRRGDGGAQARGRRVRPDRRRGRGASTGRLEPRGLVAAAAFRSLQGP